MLPAVTAPWRGLEPRLSLRRNNFSPEVALALCREREKSHIKARTRYLLLLPEGAGVHPLVRACVCVRVRAKHPHFLMRAPKHPLLALWAAIVKGFLPREVVEMSRFFVLTPEAAEFQGVASSSSLIISSFPTAAA